MKKIQYILKELWMLMREHKSYALAPVLIMLALLSALVYYIGPSVIVTFIYAGV